jgi:hypothetical protein
VDIDAGGWVLLAGGLFAGVCLTLISGAVRDAVLDAVDQVAGWWWDLVDAVRRFLLAVGLLVLAGLASWAVVALLLPRLV